MGSEPGFAIFRRFGSLNAKLLLYLQAEIVQLEHELVEIERQNSGYDQPGSLQHTVAELMRAPPGSNGEKQWKLVKKIEDRLKDYNKLMLEHEQLYKLPTPSKNDFIQLWNFLHGPDAGGNWLSHPENSIWAIDEAGKALQKDLVALSSRRIEIDPFTTWVFEKFNPWWHELFKKYRKQSADGSYEYDDEKMNRVVVNLTTVLSSLLPTASIFALYYIRSTTMRLVFILLFSLLFSASLAIFTSARRVEIFAAAVALASVQSVFIGINIA